MMAETFMRQLRSSQAAGRSPQVAKSCLMSRLGIFPIVRGRLPKAPFIGELAAEGGLRG